jgi:hypothetical protein
VEVKFFAYKGTMQEVCLRLMGKKLLAASAMEGKFTSEGLQAIDGDDDMLTAMARELVENKGIGESAASIWRNVQQLRPATPAPAEDQSVDTSMEVVDVGLPEAPSLTFEQVPTPALVEATDLSRRSSIRSSETGQLSLF